MSSGSEIAHEFLTVARDLAGSRSGTAPLQNARRRRAVSTAYYALFHALTFLCTDTLAGEQQDAMVAEFLYRALGHAEVAKTLNSADATRITPSTQSIGEAFRNLQERRHRADYAPADHLVAPHEALALVGLAATAIDQIERLDAVERLRLAVLLLAKSRPTQARS